MHKTFIIIHKTISAKIIITMSSATHSYFHLHLFSRTKNYLHQDEAIHLLFYNTWFTVYFLCSLKKHFALDVSSKQATIISIKVTCSKRTCQMCQKLQIKFSFNHADTNSLSQQLVSAIALLLRVLRKIVVGMCKNQSQGSAVFCLLYLLKSRKMSCGRERRPFLIRKMFQDLFRHLDVSAM